MTDNQKKLFEAFNTIKKLMPIVEAEFRDASVSGVGATRKKQMKRKIKKDIKDEVIKRIYK